VTNHRTGPHRTAPGRIKRQTEKKDASYKSLLACKLLKTTDIGPNIVETCQQHSHIQWNGRVRARYVAWMAW